jgi:hypothetical protein
MIFVIFGAAAGAVLALRRYTVFALVPVVVIFAAAAMVTGVAAGSSHLLRAVALGC